MPTQVETWQYNTLCILILRLGINCMCLTVLGTGRSKRRLFARVTEGLEKQGGRESDVQGRERVHLLPTRLPVFNRACACACACARCSLQLQHK
eukprot:scaffold55163_cov39-Tisochrysis_lutea.AAC.3